MRNKKILLLLFVLLAQVYVLKMNSDEKWHSNYFAVRE